MGEPILSFFGVFTDGMAVFLVVFLLFDSLLFRVSCPIGLHAHSMPNNNVEPRLRAVFLNIKVEYLCPRTG